jgi:hypothetical protein
LTIDNDDKRTERVSDGAGAAGSGGLFPGISTFSDETIQE